MEILENLAIETWKGPFAAEITSRAASALESGKLLFAPALNFKLSDREKRFLSPDWLDGKSKNISFRPKSGAMEGTSATGADRDEMLAMLRRYHAQSTALLRELCPEYRGKLTEGFTSFRPAEIAGRASSWRKDDTRLHVDAFPSRPLQGLRILRVFSNVNPSAAREWRVGEPFEAIAKTFLPRAGGQIFGSALLLHLLHVTKSRRTPYDHMMLAIHDGMKADTAYQEKSPQTALAIPPGATWACFTDSVSHAAMAGQFCFEQTFYLPVDAMRDESRSPLRVLERLAGRALI